MSRLRLGASAQMRGRIGGGAPATIHVGRILSGLDDAEEAANGPVRLASGDLELGMEDVEGENIVALRFNNVDIHRGAPIIEAYVRFTAYSFGGNEVTVDIRAEAVDDAPPLLAEPDNLRERSGTGASVTWAIPPWATDQEDADTTSPNLASLISEVTSRPGWTRGNSLVLLISRNGGSPTGASNQRAAHSYDSDPAKAPMLWINQAPEEPIGPVQPDPPVDPPIEPPSGQFASGGDRYGLLGEPGFDSSGGVTTSHTLKDGTAFTAEMADWYNAALHWTANESYISSRTDSDDTYTYARVMRSGVAALMQAFRFTGDLRLLDKILDWLDEMQDKLAVGWNGAGRNFYDKGRYNSSDWSPYQCWIWRGPGDFSSVYSCADLHMMDEPSTAAWIMQVAYACEVNKNLSSPSGTANRYANTASFWKSWLQDWQVKWQGGGTSGWRDNYRGLQYPSRRRAGSSEWPFCGKYGDTHTTVTNIAAMHYWWLLFGDNDAKLARDRLMGEWRTQELVQVPSRYGDAAIWTAGFRSEGSPSNTLQAAPYVGYVIMDCADLYYCGFDPNWKVANIREIMRSFGDFMLQSDGSTKGDIHGEVSIFGWNTDGRGRSASQTIHVTNAYGLGIPFEDQSDEWVSQRLTTSHNSYGGGLNATHPPVPVGKFIKAALQELGEI